MFYDTVITIKILLTKLNVVLIFLPSHLDIP